MDNFLNTESRPTINGNRQRKDFFGSIQVLFLAALCAVCAELLSAYTDSTGNVPSVLFALFFFAALYGAPALLAREVARRAEWGWPSLLLLTLALGIAQACLIDQSLFSENYFGYEGWHESRQAAFIPILSIGANQAFNFIIGHVIFSFGAPIAIAEAWRPHRALLPWLGPVGIVIATVAYAGAALLIAFDPTSQNATAPQFAASVVLVIVCILAAWLLGRALRSTPRVNPGNSSAGSGLIFIATLIPALAVASDIFGESWGGLAFNATTIVVIGAFVWWRARQPGWGVHHSAAVALAFLVSRGALAFTYFPLAGQVEPSAKYAHNIAMMLIVFIAGWYALRPLPRAYLFSNRRRVVHK